MLCGSGVRYIDAPRCVSSQPSALVYTSLERAIEVVCDVDAFPAAELNFQWMVRNTSTMQQPRTLNDFVINGDVHTGVN